MRASLYSYGRRNCAPRLILTSILSVLFQWIFFAGECDAAVLTGSVLDVRGNPVAHYRLLVLAEDSAEKIPLSTGQNGRFSLTVKEGRYRVLAAGCSDAGAMASFPLGVDESRNIVLLVGEDGQVRFAPQAGEKPRDAGQEEVEDPYLRAIRDYRVQVLPSEAAESNELRRMAELVNPFPAQKRGRLHGSIYEFHRNDNFDARNFFDPVGVALPEYKRNQFGVSIGAAVGRSLNLLGSYDGLRIVQGSTLLSHVATADMKRGDFSRSPVQLVDPSTHSPFEGNKIPESRINETSKRLLGVLPDPNRDDPDRNFVNNDPIEHRRDTLALRGDYQFRNRSSFVTRYSKVSEDDIGVSALPSFGYRHQGRDQDFVGTYNQKISPRLLASWQFSFGRNVDVTGSENAGQAGLLESLGIPGLSPVDPAEEGYPGFSLSGYASFGDSGFPYMSTNNRFGIDGSITITPQKHTFRAGGGISAYQSNNNRSDGLKKGRFTFNGYYSGDAFADFLLGFPDSATRAVGTDRADLRRRTWYFFARDEWKLNPKLNLSWGLTYNYYQPFYSVRRNVAMFHPLLFEPPLSGEMVIAGSERAVQLGLGPAEDGGMLFPDRTDWAPSTGVAYRPFGSNRLVLRSYYSISYAPLGVGNFVNNLTRNYPFFYTESAISSPTTPGISMDAPFVSAAVTALGVRGIDPHLRTGYVGSWGSTLQTEIFRQWHIQAAYSGNKGTRLARNLVANVPLPGPDPVQPRRPNPEYGHFNILTGSGAYTRNAFSLDAERRLADGISFKTGASWTLGMNDLNYGNPSNPRNLAAERARSETPARQFYLSYILDLPFGKGGRFLKDTQTWLQPIVAGWRLSGITHFQDGARFSVISAGDPNNDGVADDRPDRRGSGVLEESKRSIDQWFAINDFAAPADYSYGNSGRNILTAPPYANWDLSVIKQTRIRDGRLVELRIELFNAFNQVNFEAPSPVFGTSVFGKIFGARRAREIEVALRYGF